MPPVNIIDHRGMAQDDLSDGVAQNIAYYLGLVGQPGSIATGKRVSTVASSAGISNTETLLIAVPLILPTVYQGSNIPGTLNVGTLIRATFYGTCTDTVANASTFTMRMGTAGTVAGDTSVATWVTSASGTTGTAVPFEAVLDITIQTLTATGTASSSLVVNSQTTGIIGAATSFVVQSASAITALPTTTATFLDFSYSSAASTTTSTFQGVVVEIFP